MLTRGCYPQSPPKHKGPRHCRPARLLRWRTSDRGPRVSGLSWRDRLVGRAAAPRMLAKRRRRPSAEGAGRVRAEVGQQLPSGGHAGPVCAGHAPAQRGGAAVIGRPAPAIGGGRSALSAAFIRRRASRPTDPTTCIARQQKPRSLRAAAPAPSPHRHSQRAANSAGLGDEEQPGSAFSTRVSSSVTERATRVGGGPASLVNKLDPGSAWGSAVERIVGRRVVAQLPPAAAKSGVRVTD